MNVEELLSEVKNKINEAKRNRKFKKANMEREEAAKFQASLAMCRGKLETCLKDYDRTIKTQYRNIADGKKIGADTLIQEQMMWDAGMGYLLIKDSIFALKTISSYDTLAHANEVLDASIDYITKSKKKILKMPSFSHQKKREEFESLKSKSSVASKEEILESIFEQLKATGDIEKCLSDASSTDNVSSISSFSDLLDSIPDDVPEEVNIDDAALKSLDNIHPPKA